MRLTAVHRGKIICRKNSRGYLTLHPPAVSPMVGKKTEIPISSRLLLKGDDWKAYDVIVDGISLVRNY